MDAAEKLGYTNKQSAIEKKWFLLLKGAKIKRVIQIKELFL